MDELDYSLLPGTLVDRYRIEKVLGAGGFGITYQAWDTRLEGYVALKEFFPHDIAGRAGDTQTIQPKSGRYVNFQKGLNYFLDEAKRLNKFRHRNIVRVSNFIEANGTGYIAMDYELGESLSDELKRTHFAGGMPETRIKQIILPILNGLVEVHKAGMLHRDIKPGNIYLRREGEPTLIDFGAARQNLADHSKSVSAIASAGFSPSEQYSRNSKRQGPWSDIYAVGAVCYKLITGHPPVEGTERSDHVRDGLPDPLQPLTEHENAKHYSNSFLGVLEWCLNLDPRLRPQNALQVIQVLTKTMTKSTSPQLQTVALSETAESSHAAVSIAGEARKSVEDTNAKAWKSTPNRFAFFSFCLAAVLIGVSVWVYLVSSRLDSPANYSESTVGNAIDNPMVKIAFAPIRYQGRDTELSVLARGASLQLERSLATEFDIEMLDIEEGSSTREILVASKAINAEYALTGKLKSGSGGVDYNLYIQKAEETQGQLIFKRLYDKEELGNISQDSIAAVTDYFGLTSPKSSGRKRNSDDERWRSRANFIFLQAKAKLDSNLSKLTFDAVETLLESALKISPTHEPALVLKCQFFLYKQAHFKDATKHWLEMAKPACMYLLENRFESSESLITMANYFSAIGDLETARLFLGEVKNRSTDWYLAYSDIEASDGNYELALQKLTAYATKSSIYRWRIDQKMGELYWKINDIGSSISAYQRILDLYPDKVTILINLAAGYFQLGRLEDANEIYSRINSLDADFYSLTNHGTVLYFLGDFSSARSKFERAMALSPNSYAIYGNLADTVNEIEKGQDQAKAYYFKAIELAEKDLGDGISDPDIYIDLAHYHSQVQDYLQSDLYFEKSEALDSENPSLYYYRGISLVNQGKLMAAKEEVRKAAEMFFPTNLIERTPQLAELDWH